MNKIELDVERTIWANERTMLAYIRTAFASLILGFGLLQFAPDKNIFILGLISIGIGIAFVITGVKTYSIRKKRVLVDRKMILKG